MSCGTSCGKTPMSRDSAVFAPAAQPPSSSRMCVRRASPLGARGATMVFVLFSAAMALTCCVARCPATLFCAMFGPCMRSFGAHAAVKSDVRLARSRWRGPCVAASSRRPFSPPGTRSTSSVRVWSAENLCAVGFVVGEAAAELARRVAQRHAVLPDRSSSARRRRQTPAHARVRPRPVRSRGGLAVLPLHFRGTL